MDRWQGGLERFSPEQVTMVAATGALVMVAVGLYAFRPGALRRS